MLSLSNSGRNCAPDARYTWVAETAGVIGRVRLAEGASVWYGAVLRGDNDWITLGCNCNIQDGSVLHTDSGIALTLADNVSIPVGGGIVMHLGDDLFAGAVNSQFQKKTDGAELVFVIEDWAAKVQAGYTKATVYLDAKG